MTWPHVVACFFAGLFLGNAVPHYVRGVCGDRFPTPFAKPPGRGLSSPLVNVLWGLLNAAIGYALCRAGQVTTGGTPAAIALFAGVTLTGVGSAIHFEKKHPS